MSYQVLARKWRPRNFSEMVGQEHVLRALINALDNDRLHHAFLFTGTRGVGKTTIARILAKSLNCEQGISSRPCGVCSACQEIDDGRFVDLIEVDAASRTKVEDTRELLDNVQYAPTRGRYKVYLIDEVHMLSNHSFNALLKTLEEPPPHVKFLLATTDPQKLPVTILSRCLQFNLRRLPAERIRDHLTDVLGKEGIEAESAALALLARAADGSMRDALSLLDQAIAFGGGRVGEADVSAMLGTLDQTQVYALLEALSHRDGAAVLAQVAALAEQAPDFGAVLAELLSVLHRLALLQVCPEAYVEDMGDRGVLEGLARALAPEDVQLFYQIGVMGQRDLPLAPDPRIGLEMTVLRMLAFQPADSGGDTSAAPSGPAVAGGQPRATGTAGNAGATAGAGTPARSASPDYAVQDKPARHDAVRDETVRNNTVRDDVEPDAAAPASESPVSRARAATDFAASAANSAANSAVTTAAARASALAAGAKAAGEMPQTVSADTPPAVRASVADGDWHSIVATLRLNGVLRQIALNTALLRREGAVWFLALDPSCAQLLTTRHQSRLEEALAAYCGEKIKLDIAVQAPQAETPAARDERERGERQAEAVEAIEHDANVQAIVDKFNARILPDSIQPRD